MKSFLKYLLIIITHPITIIYQSLKNISVNKKIMIEFTKISFKILLPLIISTIIFYFGITIISIALWHTPDNFYFPFLTGGVEQGVFDRSMFMFGIAFAIFDNN